MLQYTIKTPFIINTKLCAYYSHTFHAQAYRVRRSLERKVVGSADFPKVVIDKMGEHTAMLISEQRRNPQLSYKSDIIFISGKRMQIILLNHFNHSIFSLRIG